MGTIYREAETGDSENIEKFLVLVKNDYVPQLSDTERKDELEKINKGKAKAILATTDSGQIIGCIIWEQYSKNKNYGYITNLAVHSNYRGRGISMELRRMTFEEIKIAGFKGIYYTTWHKNASMIESSKKLGMKTVEIFPHESYRGPGGKTVILKKISKSAGAEMRFNIGLLEVSAVRKFEIQQLRMRS